MTEPESDNQLIRPLTGTNGFGVDGFDTDFDGFGDGPLAPMLSLPKPEQTTALGAFTPSPHLPMFCFPPHTPLYGSRGRSGFFRAVQHANDSEASHDGEWPRHLVMAIECLPYLTLPHMLRSPSHCAQCIYLHLQADPHPASASPHPED